MPSLVFVLPSGVSANKFLNTSSAILQYMKRFKIILVIFVSCFTHKKN